MHAMSALRNLDLSNNALRFMPARANAALCLTSSLQRLVLSANRIRALFEVVDRADPHGSATSHNTPRSSPQLSPAASLLVLTNVPLSLSSVSLSPLASPLGSPRNSMRLTQL